LRAGVGLFQQPHPRHRRLIDEVGEAGVRRSAFTCCFWNLTRTVDLKAEIDGLSEERGMTDHDELVVARCWIRNKEHDLDSVSSRLIIGEHAADAAAASSV
jgi:hypothetical protein